MPTADDYRGRLERAGWSMLEECPPAWAGDSWGVSGSRGASAIAACGATREEAWQAACRQAEGLLPPE